MKRDSKRQLESAGDEELLRQAREGRYEAFEALVGRYESRVYALARRLVRQSDDAQEVAQETFISLLEHLGDFRGESSFATWLLRIATNHALKLLRRRRTTVALDLSKLNVAELGETVPKPDYIARWRADPAVLAEESESRRAMERAIMDLDEKYRAVFVLRDLEGLSTGETAKVLGIGEANVKVRLLRARLMLREQLTRRFGDPATQMRRPANHDGGKL
jgi:RNA polymerase sigma-70 factor (ECF subfamily)